MALERHIMEMTELVAGLAPNDPHRPFLEAQMQRANDMLNPVGLISSEIELSPRESQVLGLMAVGAVNKEIAARLGVSEQTIKNHCTEIFHRLHVGSRCNAVVRAVKGGLLDLDKLSEKFDLEKISFLTPRMITVLSTIVEGIDGNKELAFNLGLSTHTIKNLKKPIFERLSVDNTVQAILFYMAADKAGKIRVTSSLEEATNLSRREVEVLKKIALGLTNKEIATELYIEERTVKNHCGHIFEKLGVESRLKAVIVGISQGLVDLNEVSSNFDLHLLALLTASEKEVLAQIIPGKGKYEQISEALGIAPDTVSHHLMNIYRKIGVSDRVQAGLFYLVAQKAGMLGPQAPQGTP